jgi:hypothetical protein
MKLSGGEREAATASDRFEGLKVDKGRKGGHRVNPHVR